MALVTFDASIVLSTLVRRPPPLAPHSAPPPAPEVRAPPTVGTVPESDGVALPGPPGSCRLPCDLT